MSKPNKAECQDCDFVLWQPISQLRVSQLALYSDSRFPGRAILSLSKHYEYLEDVPPLLLKKFMLDAQDAITAIKRVTGAERVNFAVLGNAVPHVHAHLIPRKSGEEPEPTKAPWEDTRSKAELPQVEAMKLVEEIRVQLTHLI